MIKKGCDLDTILTDPLCAALVNAGYVAVGRYTKNWTAAEITLCRKYGLGIWAISEPGDGGWDRISQGAPKGGRDATTAVTSAKEVGFPSGYPIFAAFDFDAESANITDAQAYMDGSGGYSQTVRAAGYKSAMYADGLIQTSVATDCGGYVPGASAWAGSGAYITNGRAALVQHPTITFAETEIDSVDIYDTGVIWFPAPPKPIALPLPVAPAAVPPRPSTPVVASPVPAAPAVAVAPVHAAPIPAAPVVYPPPAAPVVAPPAPTIPSVLQVQTMLKEAGAYIGALDGIWGPQSIAALSRYYMSLTK